MSETITAADECGGSRAPMGEPWPGLLPLRECPACHGMYHPTRDDRMPKHKPATAAELVSLARSKRNLLYIVFRQGTNWATVAPVVHADIDAARRDADTRGATVTGFPRQQAQQFAHPA